MNEQLQAAVAAMITKAVSAFEKGADFMSEQIPDVVHQLLMWHATKSAVLFALGIVMVIAWLIVDYKLFKMARAEDAKSEYSNGENTALGWGVIGCIPRVLIIAVAASMINITWLQIWIAPKVWLIEYAASLVK